MPCSHVDVILFMPTIYMYQLLRLEKAVEIPERLSVSVGKVFLGSEGKKDLGLRKELSGGLETGQVPGK